ncbi:MAG: haloalkane dehalogenase [Acidobacteriota bacterium]
MKTTLVGLGLAALLSACSSKQDPPPSAPMPAHASTGTSISAELLHEKRFIEVKGSRMAYLDEGEGPTVLFVHGNPTSSYLWRNVIPFVTPTHRAIAVDLIGMGDSDKPDIDYTLQDQYEYLEAFIEKLDLKDLILVGHDWGGGLTPLYAARNSRNVRAIALMEPAAFPMLPMTNLEALGERELIEAFTAFRDAEMGPKLLLEQNAMVEVVLPGGVLRPLSVAEMNAYRKPFPTPESRKPAYTFPNEIPIAGSPARNVAIMEEIGAWLTKSAQPKLVLYASPGMLVSPNTARILASTYRNVQVRYIGAGVHFIQEDQPETIGRNLSDWLHGLS